MNESLKKIIFDKLYEDLSHVEIIPYKSSFWFIGREEKYWYLEYEKSGSLWWRYEFFTEFFKLFSMERIDFEPLITEWVEEVLNYKVNTSLQLRLSKPYQVEEVLNHKVNTLHTYIGKVLNKVEEVLNYKVNTSNSTKYKQQIKVEEILNYKVNATYHISLSQTLVVEEMLNFKVNTSLPMVSKTISMVEEVLNYGHE